MRIVVVGNFALTRRGTMAARALPIAGLLAERGHDVTMLLPPWDDPTQAGRVEVVGGVRVENARLPHLPAPLLHAVLIAGLLARIHVLRPDVLYLFKPKAHAGVAQLATWLVRRAGTPRVVVDTDDWEGSGGWADLLGYPWPVRRFVDWHERWCLRHADAVTIASRALVDRTRAMGVPANRIVYLPNGVGPASPTWSQGDGAVVRERLKLGSRPVVLLFSRFFDFAPARVAAVFRRVADAVPDVAFLVAGLGERGEESAVRDAFVGTGLAEATHLVGWLPIGEVREYLAAADVAYVPLDPTPINRARCSAKLIDIVLAGLPVVAEDVGQIRGYVASGETGCVVPPGDVEAASTSLIGLLRDPMRRHAFGVAARSQIVREHTWRGHGATIVSAVTGQVTLADG